MPSSRPPQEVCTLILLRLERLVVHRFCRVPPPIATRSSASPDAARSAVASSRDASATVEDANVDADHAPAPGPNGVAHDLIRIGAHLSVLIDREQAVGLGDLQDRDAEGAERRL